MGERDPRPNERVHFRAVAILKRAREPPSASAALSTSRTFIYIARGIQIHTHTHTPCTLHAHKMHRTMQTCSNLIFIEVTLCRINEWIKFCMIILRRVYLRNFCIRSHANSECCCCCCCIQFKCIINKHFTNAYTKSIVTFKGRVGIGAIAHTTYEHCGECDKHVLWFVSRFSHRFIAAFHSSDAWWSQPYLRPDLFTTPNLWTLSVHRSTWTHCISHISSSSSQMVRIIGEHRHESNFKVTQCSAV